MMSRGEVEGGLEGWALGWMAWMDIDTPFFFFFSFL
jgi:hypothetical protein